MLKTSAGRGKKKSATKNETSFPIVAIGASSGGLEAVTELFQNLPPDTGMAFIFIQHLSPDYKSMLVTLLAKSTEMAVQEIVDMERMEPNNVYVIPHNKGIEVTDGHIHLIPRPKNGPAMSIDVLFTSLAETHAEDAIGIILSGNASDGTQGLKAIRQEGGITFAQDNSAKYSSMPESAINEGVADFILSPKEIALELGRISKHIIARKKSLKAGNGNAIDDSDPDLRVVLQLLHEGVGVDFSHYKMNTIKRRILRRMFFHKFNTMRQYVKLLKTNGNEVNILYNDLLINFTDFFRDTEAFEYFKTTLFPKLLKNKKPNETLRIWVAACATGQEAYSMAILLTELLGNKYQGKQVQIFATDLSEPAIKKARTGEYSKHDIGGVSPKRLARFFAKSGDNYRIVKSVRDLCTFAPHNILSNPPFSRIDFISCCNLFIYLDTAMQKKALATFHYALNDGGSLILGKSENMASSQLFSGGNREFKVYTRKDGVRSLPDLNVPPPVISVKEELPETKREHDLIAAPETTINSILFSRYIPAYVVINHALVILEFKGPTTKYLQHTTGRATLNILNMARPEIAFELLDAINKAILTKQEVHKQDIEIKNDAVLSIVALDVIPLKISGEEPMLLIVFTEQVHTEWQGEHYSPGKNSLTKNNSIIKKLKEEVAVVRAELISVSDEKEKANKVLQAAQEEILSSNEEFQCMNEELETSKEEIESANEELITTNQELQTRNDQIAEAYDLAAAIVTTLHEPILVLDKHLRVKSANTVFYKNFLVQQQDTEGRLLYELGNHQWDIPALRELLEDIIPKETYIYDYEITHEFPGIGRKTMLLNARQIIQKVNHEQLILLAFTDTTERNRKGKAERQELEDIISERTAELKQSYRSLKEQNISLEKMNKELETFTFLSSHDLQEPLRKIKNFSSILLDEEQKKLSANGKEYLQRMHETAKRMQQLIEDLLSYSRVKNTQQSFEKTDLGVIIGELITDFKETIDEKKAVIKSGKLCDVSIIRFQFRQLMFNLISNSLKFADPKRPPVITVKCNIVLGSKLNNERVLADVSYCHLTVTDNGIGFDPQYKDRIFNVFERLHEYDEFQGTGMGLAICKRIVENHNGIITATGKLNKGATFDIYIPVIN